MGRDSMKYTYATTRICITVLTFQQTTMTVVAWPPAARTAGTAHAPCAQTYVHTQTYVPYSLLSLSPRVFFFFGLSHPDDHAIRAHSMASTISTNFSEKMYRTAAGHPAVMQ
jgi:hypothetical protein